MTATSIAVPTSNSPGPSTLRRRFDRRVQLFDPPGREMFTSDKKNVTVDVYVCWRIAEADGRSDSSGGTAPCPVLPRARQRRPGRRTARQPHSLDPDDDDRSGGAEPAARGQEFRTRSRRQETGPLEKLAETVRSEAIRRPARPSRSAIGSGSRSSTCGSRGSTCRRATSRPSSSG